MRVLQVIHGYPMRYNAGSEVYTQALAQALAARHEVHVFTRVEDPFAPDAALHEERDPSDTRVRLHLVNNAYMRDRYRHEGIDRCFSEVVARVRPDIVHIGHLNHLSTSLVNEASRAGVPIVFTLHDYWLMCPRGQLMQMHPDAQGPWPLCPGQQDRRCAERCYARYFSGATGEEEQDIAYWTDWVRRRMVHARELASQVRCFIAPSRYLLSRFRDDFGLPADRLRYLDYGFDPVRLAGRQRRMEETFAFGYIGTHIPAKGIHLLIAAFAQLRGDPILRIWGRPRGETTPFLQQAIFNLPGHIQRRIQFLPEYRNQQIVADVFDHVDAIVVPSIWYENSPLVIHEAQAVRVPVITADVGGMSEYVGDEQNGLLFRHRDADSLAVAMQRMVDDPVMAARLGQRGYLGSEDGQVPRMEDHVRAIEQIYSEVQSPRASTHAPASPGPWRITFDTNPDDCNLRCIMCEEHSPHSPLQIRRRERGEPRRRMDIDLLRRVLAERRGSPLREIIPSTMGEPLLYEHFDDILALCQEYGVKLNLTTNGTFPRRGARAWAECIVPVTSDVKISWNGASAATAERIMIGVRWDQVLSNVRDFIAVRDEHAAQGGSRCRVTFQLTFLEINVDELADIVRLAAALGVDRVKGHHLWAHFDQIKGLSMRRDAAAIARWNSAVRAARAVQNAVRLPSGDPVLLENIFELSPEADQDLAPGGPCPFLGKEAWISAEGRFSPCCAPDAQRRTLGDFGSLHERTLGEIWDSAAYRKLQAEYQGLPLCRSCNMRQPVERAP